ncbi:flagellar hook-length control protein FliK [Jeotgalibacillus malaysiensis]|uniref:flagellar hook-length control protein FliK n=1 Tax=Jeotgalibacillus malaysiensis TaxID=1508404 RepID=UPI00384C8D39
MIGQIVMQVVQPAQQLGSVKEGMTSPNELFGAMLLNAGRESLLTDEAVLSELEVLFEKLMSAVESEDMASFLKAAGETDPAIKQMFMLFDETEMKDLTMPELLLAAGVNEELVEKAHNEEISAPEELLRQILKLEEEELPENKEFTLPNLAELQRTIMYQNVKTDLQHAKQLTVHEDLAKLVLLTKGLSLMDQKNSVNPEKNHLVQKMSEVMEAIQTFFKNTIRELNVPKQNDVLKQTTLPEVMKNDHGMLNLQTLQLQSGPVKWSLAQPLRQPDTAHQLMEQFQQVMQKAGFGKVNGTEKLMIRLQPEHLGTLKIELLQKDGMMTARIIASSAVAKEMIDSQLNQLRQSFAAQNLQVEKIEIAHTETTENKLNKDSDNQQHQGQDRQKHEQEDDEQVSFHDIFLNIEV